MKTQEEIEQLAIEHAHLKPNFDRIEEEYYNIGAINAYESFIHGYTQCQEDMKSLLLEIKDNWKGDKLLGGTYEKICNSLNKQD